MCAIARVGDQLANFLRIPGSSGLQVAAKWCVVGAPQHAFLMLMMWGMLVAGESNGGKGSINKATREKLRRERLNEHFAELATLLNLKGNNVDKLRVLSEAINTLKILREEVRIPRSLGRPHVSSCAVTDRR